jgi:hypothetical protein
MYKILKKYIHACYETKWLDTCKRRRTEKAAYDLKRRLESSSRHSEFKVVEI